MRVVEVGEARLLAFIVMSTEYDQRSTSQRSGMSASWSWRHTFNLRISPEPFAFHYNEERELEIGGALQNGGQQSNLNDSEELRYRLELNINTHLLLLGSLQPAVVAGRPAFQRIAVVPSVEPASAACTPFAVALPFSNFSCT